MNPKGCRCLAELGGASERGATMRPNGGTELALESTVTEADTFVPPGIRAKRFVKVQFDRCPIASSMGILGKKWSLLILRDMGAYGVERYNQMLRSIPGIPPKMLSTRLREMEREGLIRKVESSRSPIRVRWGLTDRGLDMFAVLMMVTAYQSKWNSQTIHPGRRSMRMHEMFDRKAMRLVERMI